MMSAGLKRFELEVEMQRLRLQRFGNGPPSGILFQVNAADAYNGFHMLGCRFEFEKNNTAFEKKEFEAIKKIFEDQRWRSLMDSRTIVAHVKSNKQKEGKDPFFLLLYSGHSSEVSFETSAGSFLPSSTSELPSKIEIVTTDHLHQLKSAFEAVEQCLEKAKAV